MAWPSGPVTPNARSMSDHASPPPVAREPVIAAPVTAGSASASPSSRSLTRSASSAVHMRLGGPDVRHDRLPHGRVGDRILAQLPDHGVEQIECLGVTGQLRRVVPGDEQAPRDAVTLDAQPAQGSICRYGAQPGQVREARPVERGPDLIERAIRDLASPASAAVPAGEVMIEPGAAVSEHDQVAAAPGIGRAVLVTHAVAQSARDHARIVPPRELSEKIVGDAQVTAVAEGEKSPEVGERGLPGTAGDATATYLRLALFGRQLGWSSSSRNQCVAGPG